MKIVLELEPQPRPRFNRRTDNGAAVGTLF